MQQLTRQNSSIDDDIEEEVFIHKEEIIALLKETLAPIAVLISNSELKQLLFSVIEEVIEEYNTSNKNKWVMPYNAD